MCTWSGASCELQGSLKAHTRVIRYAGMPFCLFFFFFRIFYFLRENGIPVKNKNHINVY